MTSAAATARESPVERLVEFARTHPVALDAVLAAVIVLLSVIHLQATVTSSLRGESMLVALVASVPIVGRRRFPMPAAIAAAVLCVLGVLFVATPGAVLPALVMGYSATVYGPRWAGPLAAAVIVVGAVLQPVEASGPRVDLVLLIFVVLGLLIGLCVWLAGALRRAQRRSVDQLRERARLLEQGRRQEVRLELLAERSRISREVHDVVAHSLSGIIAQADGGQYAASRDPERAVEVLAGIAGTGRQALDEVRGLLVMLRDTPDAGEPDAREGPGPQPGTADIPVLVEQVRAGGLPVELAVTGAPRSLPTGPALTAYRVVQEGLTNVVKHAGPGTPTRIGLDWGADELRVDVADEGARGPRPTPPGGGHGLIGMRERAALHGGRVETGPRSGGGYAVRLRLPYPAEV